jgi:hypothetical protein
VLFAFGSIEYCQPPLPNAIEQRAFGSAIALQPKFD